MKFLNRFMLIALATLMLAACGQTGALYLPDSADTAESQEEEEATTTE